jgi:predicted amidohydrolase YtcJ
VTLCHLEVQSAADLPRFAALGVVASFTPHWNGGYFQGADRWLGRERYDLMYSVKPLLAAGAVVSFSSDVTDNVEWKTGRANPFYGMQVGHTRLEVDGLRIRPRPPAGERLSSRSSSAATPKARPPPPKPTDRGSPARAPTSVLT